MRATPRFDQNIRPMDELEAAGSQTALDHPAPSRTKGTVSNPSLPAQQVQAAVVSIVWEHFAQTVVWTAFTVPQIGSRIALVEPSGSVRVN